MYVCILVTIFFPHFLVMFGETRATRISVSYNKEKWVPGLRKEGRGFMYHFIYCITEVGAGIFSDTRTLASKLVSARVVFIPHHSL